MVHNPLFGECEDALCPPMGRNRKIDPREELERLQKKAGDIQLCIDATRALMQRQEARLRVLADEIEALRELQG